MKMLRKKLILLVATVVLLVCGCGIISGEDEADYNYREMYLDNDTKDLEGKDLEAFNQASYVYRVYIDGCGSDYEKVVAAHDYIVSNCTYNKNAIDNDTLSEDDFSAYGVLVKGVSVCEGYARAFKMLMDISDIECIMVIGNAGEDNTPHAWNMVKIDGDWFHVDTTYDDPYPDTSEVVYLYLGVSDDAIKNDHTWDTDETPKAVSDKYDYAKNSDTQYDSISAVKDYIVSNSWREKEYISFVWTGDEELSDQVWVNMINGTSIRNLSYSCIGTRGRQMYMLDLTY